MQQQSETQSTMSGTTNCMEQMSSSNKSLAEMSNKEKNEVYSLQMLKNNPKTFAEMNQNERNVIYGEFLKNSEKQRDLKMTDTKITDKSSE